MTGVDSAPTVPAQEHLLEAYFRAKDGNRPHLLAGVFSEAATLEMVVNTDVISFPPVSRGLTEISDTLVRRFAQIHDNVYSFYLQRPTQTATHFACAWMVGMTEKSTGAVRVGCGRYDWEFQTQAPFLVNRLSVSIHSMVTFEACDERSIMAWLAALPYPWCDGQDAVRGAPPLVALEPLLRRVEQLA